MDQTLLSEVICGVYSRRSSLLSKPFFLPWRFHDELQACLLLAVPYSQMIALKSALRVRQEVCFLRKALSRPHCLHGQIKSVPALVCLIEGTATFAVDDAVPAANLGTEVVDGKEGRT